MIPGFSSASPLGLVGGRVYAAPGDPPAGSAIAIVDGAVARVGRDDEVRSAVGPGGRIVDLGGGAVLPAFVDGHTHAHRAALVRHRSIDFAVVRPARLADVLDQVAERARRLPRGAWIEGDSLSAGDLEEGRFPDRRELDLAAPDHPVVLRGIGKHVVAANSAALAAAGIDRDTPDPPGGRIERDATGEPTGVLHERAKLRLDPAHPASVVPRPSRPERLAALRQGITDLHALGITTIHEMVRLPEEADDFAVLREIGQLDLRVRFYYRIHETPIAIDWFEGLGIRRGLGDDWLRVLGVKISIDGWCIVRNAAVEEPYFGEPDNRGLLRIDQECLSELVGRADRQGLGIALHAVGPRAVDAALDAFAASAPLRAGPHRIEHAHLDLDRSRLRRMRELGIVWSAQPALLTTYVRDWERALGPDRTERVLRLRDGLEVGVPIVLDSDLPSGPAGPLRAIRAAVDRSAGDRRVGADQAIDLVTAWRAHTTVPAELAGDGRLGRLATGYRADLVVLDSDPFADPTPAGTTTLDETRVVATMIDGRFVHGPWST